MRKFGTSRPMMLTWMLVLIELSTYAFADDTPEPSGCTFCPEGSAVNFPNRPVIIDLGPPQGETTLSCGQFELLFPVIGGTCPEVPAETQRYCLCLEVNPPTPTLVPTPLPTFVPSPAPTVSLTPSIELCGCQPSVFFFEMSFASPCPPENDAFGPDGVADQSCEVQVRSGEAVFGEITVVVIREKVGTRTESIFLNGPFANGEEIVYESIMVTNSSLTRPPSSLDMTLRGTNTEGFQMVAEWEVEFTNECGVFNVIKGGEETAGTIIRSVSDPLEQFCPVPEPTGAPSRVTTPTPTEGPSPKPTSKPTGGIAPSCPPVGDLGKKTKKKKGTKESKDDKSKGSKGSKGKKGSDDSDKSSKSDKAYKGSKASKGDYSKGYRVLRRKGGYTDDSYDPLCPDPDDSGKGGKKDYSYSKGKGKGYSYDDDDESKGGKKDDSYSKGKGYGSGKGKYDKDMKSEKDDDSGKKNAKSSPKAFEKKVKRGKERPDKLH